MKKQALGPCIATLALWGALGGIGATAVAQQRPAPGAQPEKATPGRPYREVPAGRFAEQSYVTAPVVVYAKPTARSRSTGRLKRGDFVNLGKCRGIWCEVDAYGGSGWVLGRFIGRGDNPYHNLGPAGPGIPRQEPGTGRSPHAQPIDG